MANPDLFLLGAILWMIAILLGAAAYKTWPRK